jgi:hypothetical protein
MVQLIVQFSLYAVGLCFLIGVIYFKINETNYFLEEAVIVPRKWEEKAIAEGTVAAEAIEHEHQKDLAAQAGVWSKTTADISKATVEA